MDVARRVDGQTGLRPAQGEVDHASGTGTAGEDGSGTGCGAGVVSESQAVDWLAGWARRAAHRRGTPEPAGHRRSRCGVGAVELPGPATEPGVPPALRAGGRGVERPPAGAASVAGDARRRERADLPPGPRHDRRGSEDRGGEVLPAGVEGQVERCGPASRNCHREMRGRAGDPRPDRCPDHDAPLQDPGAGHVE